MIAVSLRQVAQRTNRPENDEIGNLSLHRSASVILHFNVAGSSCHHHLKTISKRHRLCRVHVLHSGDDRNRRALSHDRLRIAGTVWPVFDLKCVSCTSSNANDRPNLAGPKLDLRSSCCDVHLLHRHHAPPTWLIPPPPLLLDATAAFCAANSCFCCTAAVACSCAA